MSTSAALTACALACAGLAFFGGLGSAGGEGVRVRSFQPVKPISRAQRPSPVEAVIENPGEADVKLTATLVVPAGVALAGGRATQTVTVPSADHVRLTWSVEARAARTCRLLLRVSAGSDPPTETPLVMSFLAPVEIRKLSYIPEPKPIATPILVGAHNCPLWEADKPEMWANILKHPERTPALGFYDGANPQVADWETKWAVEHGVSFFIYCWYRTSQGGPVQTMFSSAIHKALFHSRFAGKMKLTIMWENQSRGRAGVADEKDLMDNLMPHWMANYFKHPSYLKVDNKPVLFIYRPEFLIDDLGGAEQVRRAFDKMRQACRDAGFDGLYILGEYRGLEPEHLRLMKEIGLDYTFAYCWYVGDNPTPRQSIDAQMSYIRRTQEIGAIPQVVTVSQAWSGWADEGTIWKIPPRDFQDLLAQARDFVGTLPPGELGSRMLLLDNWNEWGEGHYIAPYREYGFGYLDAVRKVIAGARGPHVDLIPEDIGLGPYDRAYRAWAERQDALGRLTRKKVLKPGAPEDGLVGWWAFDDAPGSPVAVDCSGNRLGAEILGARLAPGLDGNALVCDGGCAVVESSPLLSPATAVSIECWVKTDVTGLANNWIANRVFSGGINTGYRLGVLDGKPCFEVPLTDWSHHLKADVDLPTGRWVHLAGTFDGQTMRIYVDGEQHGSMERPGPINPNGFHLCLGNFEVGHPAHFTGLLDEVKLYSRALTAEEVREHYRRLARYLST